jgi:poly [ADP-ribose] polymerase 7/11/12/13
MQRDGNVDERSLFHGTDSIDTCYGICTNNFDFRLSGKNATMYGKGSYFAVTSKYSNCYTRGPMRLMFKAKVLIGSYTKGEKDLVCPPNIPGEGHKRYDSCVDDTTNPSIFIVFDRNQSYPEHLIAYRERDDESLTSTVDRAPPAHPTSRPVSLGVSAGNPRPVPTNAYPGNVQAFSSGAQAYPSTAHPQASRPQSSAAADLSGVQQVYNNPYLTSPTTPPSDLPASTVGPPESRGLSYRTSSGRVQRMSYPEKKKDESCSIQ